MDCWSAASTRNGIGSQPGICRQKAIEEGRALTICRNYVVPIVFCVYELVIYWLGGRLGDVQGKARQLRWREEFVAIAGDICNR